MADFGIDLSLLNGELGKMINLGNKLYFRQRKYIHSATAGRTKNKQSAADTSLGDRWGRVSEKTGDYDIHIIIVKVNQGELVKLTPIVVVPDLSLMTLYRNATEQVFLSYGRNTVDWQVEVYAPYVVRDKYGLEIYGVDGNRLWTSAAPTLFPAVVSSPMYFDSEDFDWQRLETAGRRAGFKRLGVVLDPSQNATIQGGGGTSGSSTFYTAALGVVWQSDYKLSKDFMMHAVGYGNYSHSTIFSVVGYNLTKNFGAHAALGSVRIFKGVDAINWFNQQVAAYNGEKWKVYTDSGPTISGVYKPETSVFYQRSTALICFSDI